MLINKTGRNVKSFEISAAPGAPVVRSGWRGWLASWQSQEQKEFFQVP
jgi:hypothetical protein